MIGFTGSLMSVSVDRYICIEQKTFSLLLQKGKVQIFLEFKIVSL